MKELRVQKTSKNKLEFLFSDDFTQKEVKQVLRMVGRQFHLHKRNLRNRKLEEQRLILAKKEGVKPEVDGKEETAEQQDKTEIQETPYGDYDTETTTGEKKTKGKTEEKAESNTADLGKEPKEITGILTSKGKE